MHSRVFLFLLGVLAFLAVATSPALLKPLLKPTPTVTVTATVVVTATPSATPDPLDKIPTATPLGYGTPVALPLSALPVLSTPVLYEETPSSDLPLAANVPVTTTPLTIPTLPPPSSPPPDRLLIPRLALDVPVVSVGMQPAKNLPGVFEWGVPDYRAAGWLNTSATFGLPGNTVLDGHHNIKGEVFRNLWTLQKGDEITLFSGEQIKTYIVSEVLTLPEQNQPLEVRLDNARYIQPTDDERLTLITCWPYESNTHRVVVVALPGTHSSSSVMNFAAPTPQTTHVSTTR